MIFTFKLFIPDATCGAKKVCAFMLLLCSAFLVQFQDTWLLTCALYELTQLKIHIISADFKLVPCKDSLKFTERSTSVF